MEKILILDDDQNLLDACGVQLRRRFKTDTAAGSAQGLAAIDGGKRYAVVVSDLRMPGPLDGVQFLSQVKMKSPDTVGVMLTGCADTQTAIDAVNQGHIFRFLTKPCSPENLVLALQAAVKQYRLITSMRQILALQLRYGQKMELVGQCAASIAEDLGHILASIQLCAETALAQGQPNYELAKPLSEIHQAATTACKITQQLVTLNRRRRKTHLQPVFLNGLIESLAVMLRHVLTGRVAIQPVCAPGLKPVAGDPDLLGQIIVHLVISARDAAPCGGKILIRADPPRQPQSRAGRFVCLSVTETGCGREGQLKGRIFEPFFAANEPGQGVGQGLWIVADIVKQHQGWIKMESEAGKGSTFKIFLPEWQNPGLTRRVARL